MSRSTHWSTIASMGPDLDADRLAEELASLRDSELDAFCIWLDEVLASLNTADHRAEAAYAFETARDGDHARSWAAPELACPVDFTELRATVVAHGEDAWRVVLAEPALLPGGWPTGLGRQLLETVGAVLRDSLAHRVLG
ncbi:DUF4240 domain-containing protein [Microlunatus flavus]|uniref:Uncharacterized protein n=1 Tax=Microlunatus flavus TaxID=1036181 RepID=A0A1H9HEW7_9ACTN|nr:hypothetical protein [Microlunatus flavus]SEQ60824.1 hypothetical protein SAMN05421756_104223 [Microlunatus flavus]